METNTIFNKTYKKILSLILFLFLIIAMISNVVGISSIGQFRVGPQSQQETIKVGEGESEEFEVLPSPEVQTSEETGFFAAIKSFFKNIFAKLFRR